MKARTASAPATPVVEANQSRRRGPDFRRVEPRRQRDRQRERPIGVVKLVGGTPIVGEEQQTDRDLRDEERLGEREQVRGDRPCAASAPVEDAADERAARADGDHGRRPATDGSPPRGEGSGASSWAQA